MKAKFSCHGERARELIATLMPFARYIRPMLDLDGVTVTVERYSARRSVSANRRYWAIVGQLADHVGYTKDELHEALLCEYSGSSVIRFRQYEIRRPLQRSSKLSTKDFSALMEIAERWCAEAGVVMEDVA